MAIAKASEYDYMVKLLIVGDSGVGKTNMLLKFCENCFHESHLSTIGIDFKLKTIDVEGKKIKMQIWDTAGQERFKTITQSYYKGSNGIILTYSVDDQASFDAIQSWMNQTKMYAGDKVCNMLVGNKSDLNQRKITYQQGLELAQSFGIPFFETSAKDGTNINEMFQTMGKLLNEKFSDDILLNPQSIIVKPKNSEKARNCC